MTRPPSPHPRRATLAAALALALALALPAVAGADLASLTAACKDADGIRFCDDGVPDAGGRMPTPAG